MPDSGGVHIPPGWLVSIAGSVFTALFGWLWKDQRKKNEELEHRVGELEKNKVSKQDLRDMEGRITSQLGRIENRLEGHENRLYDAQRKDGQ